MFIYRGEYRGYKITEVMGGTTWLILKDGERVNYGAGYFEDIYGVYKYIDKVLINYKEN